VREDLFKRRSTKDRLQALFERYAFLQRCDGYEQGTVDFLLAERRRQGSQDRGEVEAVVQAAQLGAAVIVDDRWGRNLALRSDLEYHGTIWVIERFHELELLSAPAVRQCFVALRDRGIRMPSDGIDSLLVRIGQAPL
jgi:predicted nucleic acid-binding protein